MWAKHANVRQILESTGPFQENSSSFFYLALLSFEVPLAPGPFSLHACAHSFSRCVAAQTVYHVAITAGEMAPQVLRVQQFAVHVLLTHTWRAQVKFRDD